jgi:ATP-dependent Clp protease adaptor protein ClpS
MGVLRRLLGSLARSRSPTRSWERPPFFDASLPSDEAHGVEILNDNVTPMDFVVSCLVAELSLEQDDAVRIMLGVHTRGSLTVGRMPRALAEQVVVRIAQRARGKGYPLQCQVAPSAESPPADLPSSAWP